MFTFSHFVLAISVCLLYRNIYDKFSVHRMLRAYQVSFQSQHDYHLCDFCCIYTTMFKTNIDVQFERMGSQIAINRQSHQYCYCGNTIGSIVWIWNAVVKCTIWNESDGYIVRDHPPYYLYSYFSQPSECCLTVLCNCACNGNCIRQMFFTVIKRQIGAILLEQ